MSKYYNTSLDRVPNTGGSNRVTLTGVTVKRGGLGALGAGSIPCKEVWMHAATGDATVRVTIGTTCTNTTGIKIPELGAAYDHNMYLHLPIDDLNQLYFFGTSGDIIDILYRE